MSIFICFHTSLPCAGVGGRVHGIVDDYLL